MEMQTQTVFSNYSNTVVNKQFVVTISEFTMGDITRLKYFYEKKLIGDTIMNYRALTLVFEYEQSPVMNSARLYEYKRNWYKQIIEELPGFLYFIVEPQFREVVHVLLYGYSDSAEALPIVKAVKQGEIPMSQGILLNKELKVFLLESIEELHIYADAPKELMLEVYHDILVM